ncbi:MULTISPECIES: hypothetical protein [Bacillus]|uniref:hypothetical protein n=1 Tax=Bacillus TaxID=1386 RepID=UPI00062D07DE|nr:MULTISPECIES: hypothetical protein [Bacillus cereus group]KKZ97016.1 hypothetical protein B4153_4225 [Bacillus cereus]KMP90774.1 hypothetical protein TU63_03760 [Bacillus cereus]KXI75312.1 hypothetical protein ACS54_26625 [Bacillus cereus]KXI87156.1 hypothetical protein ACS46_28500 [Bacillus cereus]MCU5205662.1 DUF4352 domain-containing protein [Bacillus paranthracis]
MKKLLLSLVCGLIILGSACSKETTSKEETSKGKGTETQKTQSEKVLTKEEFEKMYSNPKEYKGKKVDFYAKVFVQPERDKDGTYIQGWAGPNNSMNTIIGIKDTKIDVQVEDIIHIKGEVKDTFEGKNGFGATLKTPLILASSIEKSDYATAFAPAKKTIEVNQEQNQNGYKISIKKIEIADNETRVLFSIKNEAAAKFNFYEFKSNLVVNGQQFERTDNYEAKYPKIPNDLMPGVTADATLAFPKLPVDKGEIQISLEGSSENYELEMKPFNFKIQY